jgi:UDP-glucose 4-epimerase
MNILVTGGSGFVGINLIEELLYRGHRVFNYDLQPLLRQAEENLNEMAGRYHWVEGDVLDGVRIRETLQRCEIDTVIHTAVITADEARERRGMRSAFEINCCGTIEMLQAVVECGVSRFVYVSSIALYGNTAHCAEKLTEDMTDLTPQTLYEISKFASEKIALRYKSLYGLDLTSVRLGDVFGPWERPTGVRDLMSAPYQTLKMAMQGKTVALPRPNRTNWVYSRDVARAIAHVAEKRHLRQNVLNVGGPEVWSIEEWCRALKKRFSGFHYVIDPAAANVRYHALQDNAVMDITALRSAGEYCPAFGLEEALADYCIWADRFGYLMT